MRLILLSFFTLFSEVHAEEARVCKTPLYLFFANGMQNSPQEAEEELDALIGSLEGHIDTSIPWNPRDAELAYTSDNGFFLNLVEVVEEKRLENLDSVWDAYFHSPKASEETMKQLADFLADKRRETHDADDYEDQLSDYTDALGIGFHVMVVAHSQGGLITNAVWRTLRTEEMFQSQNGEIPFYKRFRAYFTATPSSHVPNDGGYTTLTTDEVIKHLSYLMKDDLQRGKAKPPLPANLTNSNHRHSALSHEFIADYLGGSPSESTIVKGVESEMQKLVELDKGEPKVASKACIEWFGDLKIDRLHRCIAQCSTAHVDMGSFACPRECPILCQCY